MKKAKRAIALAIAIALGLLTACGHGNAGRNTLAPDEGARPFATSQEALAQLDALAKPNGVDAALWDELKSALKTALATNNQQLTTRTASIPPTGEINRINDLAIADDGDGTYSLTWHYRNVGDYDQNGTVGISDITPLAQHFGETYNLDTESNSIQAVIDGSGNEKIGIEDITPIAQCFSIAVAQYSVKGADALAGPYVESATESIGEPVNDARKVLTMNIGASPQGYWQVVPEDSDGAQGEASNIAGIALQIVSVTPTEVKEGTVVTFTAEVLGAGPLSYEWDFGGGAQYETYTGASPRAVLTRETGEFPASLTVTGPTGADTYPFTLSKLAREWKYEVVLANPDGNIGARDLQEHAGKLWFYAYEDYEWTVGDAARKWIVSGTAGDWDFEPVDGWGSLRISKEGTFGIVGLAGPLFDKTLELWEKRGGAWVMAELISSVTMSRTSFVYSGDDPFITFTLPGSPSSDWIEYFWRKDGEWDRGIVDEPGSIVTDSIRKGVASTIDANGNPVLCYSADQVVGPYTYTPLRVAWWRQESGNWELIPVEGGPGEDPSIGATGYYPAIDFRPDGKLALVFSRFGPEIEGERNCQLILAVYDGFSWEKQIVEEASYYYPNSYSNSCLRHDPLGNAFIAFTFVTDTDTGSLFAARVYWFNGVSWDKYVLDEIGNSGNYIATFNSEGTPYMWLNGALEEVVIARYE